MVTANMLCNKLSDQRIDGIAKTLEHDITLCIYDGIGISALRLLDQEESLPTIIFFRNTINHTMEELTIRKKCIVGNPMENEEHQPRNPGYPRNSDSRRSYVNRNVEQAGSSVSPIQAIEDYNSTETKQDMKW